MKYMCYKNLGQVLKYFKLVKNVLIYTDRLIMKNVFFKEKEWKWNEISYNRGVYNEKKSKIKILSEIKYRICSQNPTKKNFFFPIILIHFFFVCVYYIHIQFRLSLILKWMLDVHACGIHIMIESLL